MNSTGKSSSEVRCAFIPLICTRATPLCGSSTQPDWMVARGSSKPPPTVTSTDSPPSPSVGRSDGKSVGRSVGRPEGKVSLIVSEALLNT